MKHAKAIKMLNALGQESRANIYKLLLAYEDGLSAGTIGEKLKIPSATLSFHLAVLTNVELIKSKREGRTIIFSSKNKALNTLFDYLGTPLY